MKHPALVFTLSLGTAMGAAFGASAQGLPPADAKPGECYAKVLIPAIYQTAPQQVLIRPETKKMTKIPASYRDVEKSVLVEEESYELVAVQPVYETITERVMVEPEQVVKTLVPATYRTESEEILISPARVEWKAGRGAHEKLDAATGEIMCRVEIPAKYETVTRQAVATPASTSEEVIPAKYVTVEKRVMKAPPTTQKKVIPAKYKTITVKELVEPAKFEVEVIPAEYSSVEKRQLVTAEDVQWRQIMCETNTTPQFVMRLQNALVAEGYDLGTQPNGNFGPATKAAIRKYQLNKGLPTGGLTISTVRSLGLIQSS
jgi:hypothetical protein